MKLYKIIFKHYSPKDSEEGIKGFLFGETEEEVCDYVMTKLGYYSLDNLEEEVEIYSYDEETDCDSQETITKREELLQNGGEIGLDSNDYSDAFYGITHYGWEEVENWSDRESTALCHLGLFVDAESEEEEE